MQPTSRCEPHRHPKSLAITSAWCFVAGVMAKETLGPPHRRCWPPPECTHRREPTEIGSQQRGLGGCSKETHRAGVLRQRFHMTVPSPSARHLWEHSLPRGH